MGKRSRDFEELLAEAGVRGGDVGESADVSESGGGGRPRDFEELLAEAGVRGGDVGESADVSESGGGGRSRDFEELLAEAGVRGGDVGESADVSESGGGGRSRDFEELLAEAGVRGGDVGESADVSESGGGGRPRDFEELLAEAGVRGGDVGESADVSESGGGGRSRDFEELLAEAGESEDPAAELRENNELRGVELFDLERVDYSDTPIADGFNHKGAMPEDYEWSITALNDTIMPGVQRGMSRDEFTRLDNDRFGTIDESEHVPMRRYAHVFDLYFGSDRIRLHREADGSLSVANGRHRIEMARQLGLTALPGEIGSSIDSDERSIRLGDTSVEEEPESEPTDSRADQGGSNGDDNHKTGGFRDDNYDDVPRYEDLDVSDRKAILSHLLTGLPDTSMDLTTIYGAECDPEDKTWHVYLDEQYGRGTWDRHVHLIIKTEDESHISEIGISYQSRPIQAVILEEMRKRTTLASINPDVHVRKGLDGIAELYGEQRSPRFQHPSGVKSRRMWTSIEDTKWNDETRDYHKTYDKLSKLLTNFVPKLKKCDEEFLPSLIDRARPEIEEATRRAIDELGEDWLARGLKSGEDQRLETLKKFARRLQGELDARHSF